MRLLHTGDLHLDSAFSSSGAKDSARLREESRALLRRIFECAREENCDLILIAGDLFDSKFVSPETEELFCALVDKCGLPVVVSPGNHDPYVEGGFYQKASARLGEKLLVFSSPELQCFDIDSLGVRVFGYAFTNIALTSSPLSGADIPEDNGYVRIFCGHADLASPVSRYAPVTLEELERFGFAYAALGHVHNRWSVSELGGRARYCGFAEGRSFDELGEGGVWIVDTDGEKCSCERKILSERAFYILDTEVQAEDTAESLAEKIRTLAKSLEGSGEKHLRIRLGGVADDALLKDIYGRAEELRESQGLAELEFIDETMPLLDGEYLERDTTLRGELYRILLPKLSSADEAERRTAIRALRIGIAAIDGRSIFNTNG